MLVLLVAEASMLMCVVAFQPHFRVLSGRPSPTLRPHRAGYCCGAAPGGLQMASAGGGGGSGGSGVPPPETEAEKRELANLRQLAAQSQQAPDREQQAARIKVLALQKEFQAKVGVRKMVADKATELLGKAATDPRLASAASASATETVLAKNPQVAQLDADLLSVPTTALSACCPIWQYRQPVRLSLEIARARPREEEGVIFETWRVKKCGKGVKKGWGLTRLRRPPCCSGMYLYTHRIVAGLVLS